MGDIEKLQKLILSSAKDICLFCEQYSIPYFIIGGTHLGAVRHKGFIPWDDDLDIGMKRENYERFIELWTRKANKEKYFLQTQATEKYYSFSFCKVQLTQTEISEEFSKNVPIRHGIFVDVFPYDNLPDGVLERKIFLGISHIIKNVLWVKCGYGTDVHKKQMRYRILRFVGVFTSINALKKMQSRWVTRYNKKETTQCFNCDYPKQQIMNKWLNELVQYPFEDVLLWGIGDYDVYLKHVYGDYMKLPPIEERTQHTYKEIEFGPYK